MESNIDSLPNLLSLGRHRVLLFQDENKATWSFSRLNGSVKDLGNQVRVKWVPWNYSLHIIEVVQIFAIMETYYYSAGTYPQVLRQRQAQGSCSLTNNVWQFHNARLRKLIRPHAWCHRSTEGLPTVCENAIRQATGICEDGAFCSRWA